MRFTTGDLKSLADLARAAEDAFAAVDAAYKRLSAAAKKRPLPPEEVTAALSLDREEEDGSCAGLLGGEPLPLSSLDLGSYVAPSAADVLEEEARGRSGVGQGDAVTKLAGGGGIALSGNEDVVLDEVRSRAKPARPSPSLVGCCRPVPPIHRCLPVPPLPWHPIRGAALRRLW